MRVNARLSNELGKKIEALEQAMGQNTSGVVRIAIERLYNAICTSGTTSRDAIVASGLIGCGEAEPDLSVSFKARMQEGLGNKHGHR